MSSRLTHVTPRELMAFCRERGVRPKKSLGQNFLTDRNLLQAIVQAAAIEPGDVVLEIGAGLGQLTELLAAQARAVITVEIDDVLAALTAELLAGLDHVRVVRADILGPGKQLSNEVVEAVAAAQPQRLLVVGDLPYNISTRLLTALLTAPLPIASMTLTVQLEVAARLTAAAGTKAYGHLSVLAQLLAEVSVVRKLPPHVFWPRPNVRSATVRVVPRLTPDAAARLVPRLEVVASPLFQQRRKNAASVLATAGLFGDRTAAREAFVALGIAPAIKSDALTPAAILRLAEAIV